MMTQLNDFARAAQNICIKNDSISTRLYEEYGVNLGLRDENGNGVVKIVSKSVQDEEGKYLTDSEENYTKVYEVEDDSNA